MKINADYAETAIVAGGELPWISSPLPGVKRRMLERDGEEVARVTSLVRYAAGSRFSGHSHDGGEEFLVLEGTFSDQYGDFPVGTYVRNPVGSRHAPHSDSGCLIFVKLWWMQAEDAEFVRIDTTEPTGWRERGPGIEAKTLHAWRHEAVSFLRMAPGAVLPAREIPGGEEILVVDGGIEDTDGRHGVHAWLRRPGGMAPLLESVDGARLLVKHGQLAVSPMLLPVADK